jgi:hypothetical protein
MSVLQENRHILLCVVRKDAFMYNKISKLYNRHISFTLLYFTLHISIYWKVATVYNTD